MAEKAENCQNCYINEKKGHEETRQKAKRDLTVEREEASKIIIEHKRLNKSKIIEADLKAKNKIKYLKASIRIIIESKKFWRTKADLFTLLEDIEVNF